MKLIKLLELRNAVLPSHSSRRLCSSPYEEMSWSRSDPESVWEMLWVCGEWGTQCKRIRAYMTHRESHDHPQTRASLMSKMKITQKCNVCVLRGGWLCFFQHCLPPVWLVSNGSSIRISKNTACVNGFNNLVFCAELDYC